MRRIVLAAGLLLLTSCGRQPCEDGGEGPRVRLDLALGTCNAAPEALIRGEHDVPKRQLLKLDGSESFDPNQDQLEYRWSLAPQSVGAPVRLEGTSSAEVTLIPERGGELFVQLVVSDGELESEPAEFLVRSLNVAPVADAGDDFTAPVGTTVELEGNQSLDGDLDPITYEWRFSERPAGSLALLDAPKALRPRFLVDVAGTYHVELVVNDGEAASAPDIVRVGGGVTGDRPVARARLESSAVTGRPVHLDGSSSTDPESAPLVYAWRILSQPAGSTSQLGGADTARASFVPSVVGRYDVELVVNDGFYDSAPQVVQVSVAQGTGVAGALCEVDGCAATAACFEGTCVGVGRLRFSLRWDALSDFDLHVKTPNQVEIYFGNDMEDGGELDVDDCVGSSCRTQTSHVENIVFEMTPSPGVYYVWVENYNGAQAGDLTIEVSGAAQATFRATLPATQGASTPREPVTVR